ACRCSKGEPAASTRSRAGSSRPRPGPRTDSSIRACHSRWLVTLRRKRRSGPGRSSASRPRARSCEENRPGNKIIGPVATKKKYDEEDGGVATEQKTEKKLARPKLYKVILHNDDFTTMEFV